jgi:hypothetical protein
MENLTEVIALIFSGIALFVTVWVYLRHGKNLKRQEQKLNELQKRFSEYALKTGQGNKADVKKAAFNAYLVGNNEIYIRNIGQATAKDVKVELPPKIQVLKTPFPANINPDSEAYISIAASMQNKGVHVIQISWNDDSGTGRSEKHHIQL